MKKAVTTTILVALCAGTANSSETTLERTNRAQTLNIELTATIAGPESTTDGVVVQCAQHKRLTTADIVDAFFWQRHRTRQARQGKCQTVNTETVQPNANRRAHYQGQYEPR